MSHLWPTKGARKYTMLCGQKKKKRENSKNVKARTHQAEFFMPRGEQWFLSIKYMNGKSN